MTKPIPMPTPVPVAAPSTITVPLTALAQPDDKEAMQTPAKGDSVSFQGEATVVDVVGENAVINLTAINGNDLEGDEGTPEEELSDVGDLDEQEANLRQAMGGASGPVS